jgi:mannose-6-phosphate isomerase-like protein (cupin superfamily)
MLTSTEFLAPGQFSQHRNLRSRFPELKAGPCTRDRLQGGHRQCRVVQVDDVPIPPNRIDRQARPPRPISFVFGTMRIRASAGSTFSRAPTGVLFGCDSRSRSMTDAEIVRAPLLGQVLGTKDTDFAIHEIQDVGHPPGTFARGVPLHVHRTEDEAWYVIEGSLRFQCGTREFGAEPGAGVLLPHGTPHTFWNPGPGSARYLLIVGPQTESLLKALHGPERPDPRGLRAIYDAFEAELLE